MIMTAKLRSILFAIIVAVVGLAGCTVGPNYQRPSVDVPGAYRGVAPDASDKSYERSQPPQNAPQALNALMICRSLERVADHATNIAEDVIFWVQGADVRHHKSVAKTIPPPAAV